MIVYRTKNDLSHHLNAIRKSGKSIGLVPTMGALHKGHTSLVEKAAGENGRDPARKTECRTVLF